ncbi:MAG: iron-containing alcohol dehydrogenase [Lachnospiraceae bacterium]|nr:iron-containing alcohol dehydrogenase [Lachnospiraceae bacterium]
MEWSYKQPVEIIFGNGKLEQLPEWIGDAVRPIVISSNYFAKSGLVSELARKLGGDEFTDVSPNPDVSEVNRCSRQIRENRNDLIIAVGGGSVIDLAKAASAIVDDIAEYHGTGRGFPQEHIPVIAIPTTAGTGSEVTNVAVLTNRMTGKKMPIVSDSFYPKLAIVDPLLTRSMPPQITASSGIDVLCHAVEGYWSKGHQPICDALAIHAIRIVFNFLPVVYQEPDHLEAREKMAEASLLAGLAFTVPKTTSSHACSFPLTSIYGIPHGEACGLTLDYFARVNAADERTVQLAKTLGFASVEQFADAIIQLKKQVGLRTDLAEFHLSEEAVEELVSKSHHPNLLNNPVVITDEILYDLYATLRG